MSILYAFSFYFIWLQKLIRQKRHLEALAGLASFDDFEDDEKSTAWNLIEKNKVVDRLLGFTSEPDIYEHDEMQLLAILGKIRKHLSKVIIF